MSLSTIEIMRSGTNSGFCCNLYSFQFRAPRFALIAFINAQDPNLATINRLCAQGVALNMMIRTPRYTSKLTDARIDGVNRSGTQTEMSIQYEEIVQSAHS